jgi:hypothetical protein
MSTSFALRSSSSGPQFTGNTGDLLTLGSDGKASFQAAPSGDDHKVAVSATDAAPNFLNFKLTSAQGIVLALLNPGADELISIEPSPNPSFLPEFDAGNKTGAASVDVGSVDGCAQRFTLTGNTTLTINGKQASRSQWYQFKVIQGGAGSFTLAIVGAKTPGGLGLTLSTAVGAQDIVSVFYDGTTLYAQVTGLAFA